MPDVPELTTLLAGTYITYFHCLRIVELLRVSEADTRNIFGRYSSQRMTDWVEIVKLFQANNAYLGECSQLIQHKWASESHQNPTKTRLSLMSPRMQRQL
jgi:hypothetical protein